MATHTNKIELNAEPRTVLGSAVKHLRKDGYIPAILYGKKQDPLTLQVHTKDFAKVFGLAGESSLVYVKVGLPAQAGGQQTYPVIIHDVTRDALDDSFLHADFYKVQLDEKIKTKVPVVFEGESPAVKDLGGIFVRNVNELEVEALPQDLPHEIKVDISKLAALGDQILVKDLNLGSSVRIEEGAEAILATVQEPMSEEELKASLEAPTEAVEEVEVIKKEKPEEAAGETAEPSTEAPASQKK